MSAPVSAFTSKNTLLSKYTVFMLMKPSVTPTWLSTNSGITDAGMPPVLFSRALDGMDSVHLGSCPIVFRPTPGRH